MESWRGPYRSTRPTRQGSAPSRLRDRVASGARGLVVTLGPFAITVAPTLGAAAVERCADRGPAVPATRMRAGTFGPGATTSAHVVALSRRRRKPRLDLAFRRPPVLSDSYTSPSCL